MKRLFICVFVILSTYEIFARVPEMYFKIDDNSYPAPTYVVKANRISHNDPLFGLNFMEVDDNNNIYDEIHSEDNAGMQQPLGDFEYIRGFNFLRCAGAFPEIGEGKIRFEIYRNDVIKFQFSIDLVSLKENGSPDIAFEFHYVDDNNISMAGTGSGNDAQTIQISNNSFVNCWDFHGQDNPTITYYTKPVTLTNLLDGSPESDITTTFNSAPMGFPDNSAQLGVQYNPGTTVNLWRGVYYNISTSHTSYVKNGINYNFRNWNNYAAETCSLRVLSNTSEFRSMYYPTTSLTIANNLEGGSSNNEYDLTWNDASLTQPWQYGQIFNAFDYADNSDDYTVEAVTPMPAINTTWWFQKWADGSTSNIKSNIQVTSPITYTAYYKGIQRSDDQDGYSSTSQRKFVKTFDGKLHYVYSSMGHLWYEISSDGGNSWQIANNGDYLDNGNGKLPSIYQFGYPTFWPCVIIVFQEKNGDNYNLKIKTFYNGILSDQDEFYIDENYSANSNPVVAVSGYCNYYRFIVVLQNTQGLYYKFGTVSIDGQLQWVNEQNGLIYGSDQNSNHPTITGNEIGITSGNFYLAWQENGDQIKYKNVHYSNDATGEPVITSESLPRPINPVEFSYNSGFRFNYLPSISLTGSTYSPIISWVGHNGIDITKVITKRGTTGNFQLLGDNVNNVNNNSTSESTENTVIIWSEGNPAVSKWTKRTGTIYHSIGNLYNTGIQTQVSNASSLSSIKAMVFNDQTAPYFFTLDNDNFSAEPEPPGHEKIKEIGTQLTYGRSGLVGKNQVNFVFNIGDIILADTNVQFIPRPDTIIYTNNNELNQVTRSLTFHLNSQSELYFTNYYYTVNADMADSALTEDDAVTFRAELVNANTDEVAGTFDNITYTKNNLDKYDNINYQVDCSGIEEGDYYLRLVTTVVGEANYNLANVQNDNPGLAKRNYKNINYTGKEAPIIYDLSQNYPNPFNPATTINYQVPENSFVTLKVYDILGKEVTTLVNEQKIQGRYSVNFDASRLASGVYIYQIRANDYVSAKKMLLLK